MLMFILLFAVPLGDAGTVSAASASSARVAFFSFSTSTSRAVSHSLLRRPEGRLIAAPLRPIRAPRLGARRESPKTATPSSAAANQEPSAPCPGNGQPLQYDAARPLGAATRRDEPELPGTRCPSSFSLLAA